MNEDEFLRVYGLVPPRNRLDEVRCLLREQIQLENTRQGNADFELLRLCVVALFNSAKLADVGLIWRAKQSSFDASAGIEVQLLCGAGLSETKSYLENACDDEFSNDILRYILECEASGDFEGFDVSSFRRALEAY